MGILEWLLLILILVSSYQTYRRQEYWLDRQIAKAIRWIIAKIRSK
jgi:hypothetical protein